MISYGPDLYRCGSLKVNVRRDQRTLFFRLSGGEGVRFPDSVGFGESYQYYHDDELSDPASRATATISKKGFVSDEQMA